MPALVVEGIRIYYQQHGQGDPLLLLHCGLGTGGDFAAILPDLAARYTVLTPDRPGYGRSDHGVPFDDKYFTAQAHWMDRFLEALGITAACFWGWSDGGIISLWTAILHPGRVRALVVEASHLRGRKPTIAFLSQHLRPAELPADERERLARQHGADYGPSLAQKWARLWLELGRRDMTLYDGRLQEVRAPTLILHAADDPHVPTEEAMALQAAIPGARLEVLPEGGHAIHAGPAREQVLATALSFLEEIVGRKSAPLAPSEGRPLWLPLQGAER
jgi:pimeloyl-ACP methyl ester carboxylesterase